MEFGSIFRTEKTGSFDFRKGPFHDCPITHAAGKNDLFSSQSHVFSCRVRYFARIFSNNLSNSPFRRSRSLPQGYALYVIPSSATSVKESALDVR